MLTTRMLLIVLAMAGIHAGSSPTNCGPNRLVKPYHAEEHAVNYRQTVYGTLNCNYDATQPELFRSFAWEIKSVNAERLRGYIRIANTTAVQNEEGFETMVSMLGYSHNQYCPRCAHLERAVSVVLDPYRRCAYDMLDLPAWGFSGGTMIDCALLRPKEDGIRKILGEFIRAVETAMRAEPRNEL